MDRQTDIQTDRQTGRHMYTSVGPAHIHAQSLGVRSEVILSQVGLVGALRHDIGHRFVISSIAKLSWMSGQHARSGRSAAPRQRSLTCMKMSRFERIVGVWQKQTRARRHLANVSHFPCSVRAQSVFWRGRPHFCVG